MDEVVECGAEARVREVADHEEVGREEEDGEQRPTVVQMMVGDDGTGQKESFFDAEQESGLGEHSRWIPA